MFGVALTHQDLSIIFSFMLFAMTGITNSLNLVFTHSEFDNVLIRTIVYTSKKSKVNKMFANSEKSNTVYDELFI